MLLELLNHKKVFTIGKDQFHRFTESFMGDLIILYIRIKNCIPGDFYGPATRDHFTYCYVIKGKAKAETMFESYDLNAGCGFLAFSNERTKITSDVNDPAVMFYFGFKGKKVADIVKTAFVTIETPMIYHTNLKYAESIMNGFLVLGERNSEAAVIEAYSLFYEMVSFWASENIHFEDRRKNTRHSSVQDEHIARAITYIEQNYFKNIQVSQIAEFLNINPSYFSRIFKNAYQMTISSYLQRFRLEIAKNLLDNSALTINQVAIESGFEDSAYFISVFKKNFGMTPKQYRSQVDTHHG